MPHRADGSWFPSIFEKQAQVIYTPKRYLLVSGPKKAGKSVSCLHALAYELWRLNGARILFLGKTAAELYENGLWTHFTDKTLPEWIDGGFGMKWIRKDRMRALTHKHYLRVSNRFGTYGEAVLDSLEHERDVEDKYKGKEFSTIYMPELSKHDDPHVFDILTDCLRGCDIRDDQYRFIGDTNPADDGEDSWIYQQWMVDRVCDAEKIEDEEKRQRVMAIQPHLGLIEFTIDDNICISDAEKQLQKGRWSRRPDLFKRFYLGHWTKASAEGYFEDVWRPDFHVRGQSPTRTDAEFLLPEENCHELGTAWDYGAKNPCVHIIEPIRRGDGKMIFKVLDEFHRLGQRTKLEDVVEFVLEMMEDWEAIIGKQTTPLIWRHVSDRSAFDASPGSGDGFEAKEVYSLSDGRILLQNRVEKSPNSVMVGANFLHRLLFEERLYISSKCPAAIEAFSSIRTRRNGRFSAHDPFKHPLDSIRYYIQDQCYREIEEELALTLGKLSGAKPSNGVRITRL